MARILAISSQVARGAVGLSIITPALQALGHEVIALPTVILSNHPGHQTTSGLVVEPVELGKMLDALAANGWLDNIDGLLTGYLPSAAHVDFAAQSVSRVRARQPARQVMYLCDPVLGDHPKGLYIDPRAAGAIRDRLLPLADMITPNRFELGWLAGASMVPGTVEPADPAAWLGMLQGPAIVATSMPDADPRHLRNIANAPGTRVEARVRERPGAPHGTGDLFAALLLASRVEGGSLDRALAAATAGVDHVLAASSGCDALAVSALPHALAALPAWPLERPSSSANGEARS